ncbi:efflux RND transporter permease subunit [Stieleria varia]|uniref:Efflux pump membrane transporter BepG n=1 Tax=Stieleria varia TaxID=2528005 RepID=A0A5C6B0B1_9BACT|nr:efflux RND transporter permease subunit [Stieleria varia]TWU05011.1 Efflux pump membrane transporter BepG [Stieleria varia]
MSTLFFDNRRILILSIALILVAGLASLMVLPRMEDPLLTPRAATITTLLPGAAAERVESQVTEKIEQELKEIEEIKELSSVSRPGVSFIAIELQDNVTKEQSSQVWSRIRDKADDAKLELPTAASRPEFDRLDIKAYASIVALRWESDDPPRYGVLRRLLKVLKDRIDAVPGTEQSDLYGAPQEEVVVSIRPEAAASMNLTAEQVSLAIGGSDAKVSAGQMRGSSDDMRLEVSGELDTLTRLSHIPIRVNKNGSIVELADIAMIERSVRTPVESKVLLDNKTAVALAVYVEPEIRLDRWNATVQQILTQFETELPRGVALDVVFEQNTYVENRMTTLRNNLLYSAAAVFVVIAILMGIRSAAIISMALPFGALCILFLMYVLDIPIHQMSITGLIISLGLMIDNAIVVVDEVGKKLSAGRSRRAAVSETVSFLFAPLLGSTLTTILSFGPIALMPGPSGEFVGSIAVVAILSVGTSLALALTLIVTLAGILLRAKAIDEDSAVGEQNRPWYRRIYVACLSASFRVPVLGAMIAIGVSVAGFAGFPELQEQFFPPADRNQFQIELDLPGTGSIAETESMAKRIREELLRDEDIERVSWFLGESAPPFYYNIIPDRKNDAGYGQAIVDCKGRTRTRDTIQRVQERLNQSFPSVSCLVRQLEQGPPFSAPIEYQIFGPDPEKLVALGEQVRLVLTKTPDVIHTRSDFSESIPKITFAIDEQQARLAGLNQITIASELNSMLEGVTGGSILEATEELPVRVRVSNDQRADLNQIASIDLLNTAMTTDSLSGSQYRGIPLSAISEMKLSLETGSITRLNGTRMNEVQAYIRAGVLPSQVQADFQERLTESGFTLPAGYHASFAGAQSERNDAVGNLMVNGAILFTLMIATIVIATQSFRLAAILFVVAGLSVGFAIGSLWMLQMSFGFMCIVGIMGMIGIAVNDSIVVLAALKELPPGEGRNRRTVGECVADNTRHVITTTATTIVGFLPLILSGGEFWPPLAICIAGGVLGATLLALLFVPSVYLLIYRK